MRNSGNSLRIWTAALVLVGTSIGATRSQAQEGRKVLSQAQPDYPELAKRLRLQGKVKVQVIIGTDGIIKNTKIVGGNPVLVESTLEALKKWKYAPGSETTTTLEFDFHPPS